jgi:hypothetical protein
MLSFWRRFELRTHSFGLSPHGNTAMGAVIEGQVKFRGQKNRIWKHQPNAGGREVSYRAFDKRVLVKQDHACDGAKVPRGHSPLNTSVFGCAAVLDDVIKLELRQMQPSSGLKCVKPLNARIRGAKGELDALQRLSLEPICFGGLCHCCEHAIEACRVNI